MRLISFKMRALLFLFLGVVLSFSGHSQQQFNKRWDNGGANVKGGFALIGNNNLSNHPTDPYNGVQPNTQLGMVYVDIDNDPSTFQSSAATLDIQSNNPNCLKVKWAGLYWGSYYPGFPASRNTVKMKLPGSTTYVDITANQSLTGPNSLYHCFADVTTLLQGVTNFRGEYVVANVLGLGNYQWPSCGGWALYVVYEDPDPSVTQKKITIYDGYASEGTSSNITGFQTIPAGPVKAQLGLVASQGEYYIPGDQFLINNQLIGRGTYPNLKTNFFEASVTYEGNYVKAPLRRPDSNNTFGWDVDYFTLENPNNTILGNNATTVNLRTTTQGDVFVLSALAFAVETIAPKIEIEKGLKSFVGGSEVDFRNGQATIGQELFYEMRFRNIGNNDARRATFEDVFPANVNLMSIENTPTGATLRAGYPKDTIISGVRHHKVVFNLDDSVLRQNGNWSTKFRFKVKVSANCEALRDACSNFVQNQAFIKYKSALDISVGVNTFYSEGSFSGLGQCGQDPSPTNFYIVDPSCNRPMEVFMCGTQTTLTAGAGYASYQWRKQGSPTVIGTGQTLSVTSEGTYVVTKTINPAHAHCRNTLTETFVVRYDTNQARNPLLDYVEDRDKPVCGNDGKAYVQIPLCGAGTSKTFNLTSNYPAGTPIKWYKFTGTRPTGLPENCPEPMKPANMSQWVLQHTGAQWTVSNEGEYAVEVTFNAGTSNQCSQVYYFRVKLSNYDYTAVGRNIFAVGGAVCKNGEILLSNITGSDQQYQIMKGSSTIVGWTNVPPSGAVTYNSVTEDGEYTILVRQKVNPPLVQNNVCVYQKKVTIRKFDLANELTIDTDKVKCPATNRNTGLIRLRVSGNVVSPYQVRVKNKITNAPVTTYSNIADSQANAAQHTILSTLPAGTYEISLSTGGCTHTVDRVIEELPALEITSLTATPVACTDPNNRLINIVVRGGTLYPAGGGNYQFEIWHGAGFATRIDPNVVLPQRLSIEDVTVGGTPMKQLSYLLTVTDAWASSLMQKDYRVVVVDANNCNTRRELTVKRAEKPSFTTAAEPADCNLTAGKITLTLENPALASTYDIKYIIRKKRLDGSWDAWSSPQASNQFTGLTVGDYQVRVRYSMGSIVCYYPEDIGTVVGPGGTPIPDPNPPVHQRPVNVSVGDGGGPVKGFVGVTQLACSKPTVTGATIRVANVSGGEHIGGGVRYQYKLDNGAWLNDQNTFTNVAPGTHTIRVRGKNQNCEFVKDITIDPPLAAPNVTQSVTYNCEGKGIISLKPDNNNYDYSYHQSGSPSWVTNTNTFTIPTPYPVGSHTIKVYYKSKTSPNPNILIKEDFGQGNNTCSPEIYSAYACMLDGNIYDGAYVILNPTQTTLPNSCWTTPTDHTGLPEGRYMAMNVGSVGYQKPIYTKVVNDVIVGQPIKYQMYVYNLCHCVTCAPPLFRIRVVDNNSGAILSQQDSGAIPANGHNPNAWQEFSGTLPPVTSTSVRVEIVSMSPETSGNDLALDDIYVYQEPQTCNDFIEIPVLVEAGKEFQFKAGTELKKDVTCHGGNDGSYKTEIIGFHTTNGFRYRLLKGTTPYLPTSGYNTVTNGVLNFTSLSAGNYRLEVQYDASNTACHKFVNFVINQPNEMVVTPTALVNNLYLNCQEPQRQVKVTDLITIVGGTPPYRYEVTNTTTSTNVPVDSQGFVLLSEGRHTIKVIDTRNCNTATSTKTISFEVRQRQSPTLVLTRDNCAVASGTNVKATVTRHASSGSATLTYEIKLATETIYTTKATNIAAATYTFDNLPAGNYDIRVTDQYNCSVTGQIEVYTPFSATASATTKHKCTTTGAETAGVVTVTATGGSNQYRYAYMATNATPAASDYGTANTKSYPYSTTTDNVYVWVKDNVTGCVVQVPRIEVKGTPATTFTAVATHPDCAGDSTGRIQITITQGAPTYKVEVLDGATPIAEYDNTTETGFVISNLAAKTYTIKVTDVNGCVVTQSVAISDPELNATITDINRTPTACNPLTADIGFKLNATAATLAPPISGTTIKYSKDNGATWQDTPEFLNIAGGTTVSPAIGRFRGGTLVCKKELGAYVTKILGGVEVDYPSMTAPSGTCATSYNVPVKIGTDPSYVDVGYALDSKTATTWYSTATGATIGAPATGYTYTFTGLLPGRQYTIWARYKLSASATDYCYSSTSIDLNNPKVQKSNINITATPIPVCNASATHGEIEFALSGGTATSITWELRQINLTTGVESAVTGTTPTSPATIGYNPTTGHTLRVGNISLGTNILYFLKVTENIAPVGCVSASPSTKLERIPANPITFANPTAITLNCTTAGGVITANATGGSGQGFTYKIMKEDTGGTQVLRRDIRSATPSINLYRNDFLPTYLAGNPTSVTLKVIAIDKLTRCEQEAQVVVNFTPAPTFTVAILNNCTLPYSITITPTTGSVGDYFYSIDEGRNYSSGNTLQVPAGFNENKIRVMHRTQGCVGALTTSNVIVFPAFEATTRISAMPTSCTGTATLSINVTSGSGEYDWKIYNTANAVVASNATPVTGTGTNGALAAPITQTVPAGDTYRVEVIDRKRVAQTPASTCSKVEIRNLVVEAPHTPVVTLEGIQATCNTASDGQIIAKLSKSVHKQGPYTFTIIPMAAGVVAYEDATDIGVRFTGLLSGTAYTIAANSKYNCSGTAAAFTLTAPAVLTGGVVATETDDEFKCSNTLGENKVRLTLSAGGGTAPYRFSIDNVNWVEKPASDPKHTFEIPDTGAMQTITYWITDKNNCSPITASRTLHTKKRIETDITLTLNALMKCTLGEMVDIKFSANRQSTNGYEVTVKSAPTGAPAIAPHIIPAASFTIGGSGEYIYTSTMTLPQKAGTYVLEVTDKDTDCKYNSLSYIVKEIENPTLTATAQKACATTATTTQVDIALTLTGNIGSGYTYSVYRGASTTAVAGVSSVGGSTPSVAISFNETSPVTDEYRIVVKMTDTDCELETKVAVQQADNAVTAVGDVVQKVSFNCTTGTHNSDGIIELKSVIGGWGPEYLYALKYGSTGLQTSWSNQMRYENLAPDTYEILVKDTNGCEATTGAIVLVNPTQLTSSAATPITTTSVSCYGGNDGTLTVTGITGGSGNYSYSLYDATTNQLLSTSKDNVPNITPPPIFVLGQVKFEGLTAGNYKVRITDELFECTTPLEYQQPVSGPTAVKSVATITLYPDCGVAGDITVTASGGTTGPVGYTYQQVDATTDAPIGAPNNTGVFAGVISATADGTYKFLVKDMNNCESYTNIISVDAVQNLAIQVVRTKDELKCSGDAAGVIEVKAIGGAVDKQFVYELLDGTGASLSPPQTNGTGLFEHLVAGTYRVKVTKGSCAAATTADIVIKANPAYTGQSVITNVTCNGASNGTYTITTNITGQTLLDGTARKLEYAISPRLDRFTSFSGDKLIIKDLAPGEYTIIVQDQNGCRPEVLDALGVPTGKDIFEFTITEPPVFNVAVTPSTTIHEGCEGASNGEFKMTISGGKPFTDASGTYYEYSTDKTFASGVNKYYIADGSGNPVPTEKVSGLPAGNNTIWVRDNEGCEARQVTVTIDKGVDLQARYSLVYTCNGTNVMSNKVTVSVNPTEIGNVVFYLNSRTATPTNNPSFVFPAVPVGGTPQTHTIYVVNNKRNHQECEQVLTVTIDPKPALSWGAPTLTHIACHGDSTGKIVVNVTGGSGNYEYAISPDTTNFVTTNTFENLSAGFYNIIVRDVDYDCSIQYTEEIKEPTKLNVKNLSDKAIACAGAKGEISFTPEGATPFGTGGWKYTYQITSLTNASVVVPASDITEDAVTGEVTARNLSAGRYTLKITDANGCYIERVFEIEDAPSLELSRVELIYTCGVVPTYGEAPTSSQSSTYAIWVSFPTQNVDKALMKYVLKDGTGTELNGGVFQSFTRFDSNNVAVIEGITLPDDDYTMTLYYGTCKQELQLPIQKIKVRNYNPMTITDASVATEKNLIRVSVTGGKDKDVDGNQLPYNVYFNYPKYTHIQDLTTNYNQHNVYKPEPTAPTTSYYIQKGDETEWGADGKEYKKVRVYVEDAQGCGYYIDILKLFEDIRIPNFFTPNGDGQNDLWYPENIENYPSAIVEIFDRYGRFIARLKPGEGWNGLYNGKELPTGDYWYILHVNEPDDDRVFKGNFTLYR